MTLLDDILNYNKIFVEEKLYEQYAAPKFPQKRFVILTCMDTRLIELLPKSMNLKNGDVKIVKNAGAVLMNPFGSIMRSLLVGVYELQADEVFVIGHHECGMTAVKSDQMIEKMLKRGVSSEILHTLEFSGINIHEWLKGFESVEENVKHSVDMIKNHPLMASDVPVHGLVIHPSTGKLDLVVNGYEQMTNKHK